MKFQRPLRSFTENTFFTTKKAPIVFIKKFHPHYCEGGIFYRKITDCVLIKDYSFFLFHTAKANTVPAQIVTRAAAVMGVVSTVHINFFDNTPWLGLLSEKMRI